jgi:hypothetical protein
MAHSGCIAVSFSELFDVFFMLVFMRRSACFGLPLIGRDEAAAVP